MAPTTVTVSTLPSEPSVTCSTVAFRAPEVQWTNVVAGVSSDVKPRSTGLLYALHSLPLPFTAHGGDAGRGRNACAGLVFHTRGRDFKTCTAARHIELGFKRTGFGVQFDLAAAGIHGDLFARFKNNLFV